MIVKDAMTVIHLAKVTLLETSCAYFKSVLIPKAVHQEVLKGKDKGYGDVRIVEELIQGKRLRVKRVRNERLLKRAHAFNLQRGEAEAVALYWQERAGYVASDDDNLRRKCTLLNLKLIGTPAIIMALYQADRIDKRKLTDSLQVLRKIGWFSSAVIDTILLEVR